MASTGPEPAPQHRRRQSPYAWVWLAGVLALGLVVGGVLVAVLGGGKDAAAPRTVRVTVSRTVTRAPGPARGGADLHLSADCVHAVEDARRALGTLGQAGDAVRHFDLGALESVVSKAKATEQRLQAELPNCDATMQVPSGAPPS